MLFSVVAALENLISSGLLAFHAPFQVVYSESIQVVYHQLSEDVHQAFTSLIRLRSYI